MKRSVKLLYRLFHSPLSITFSFSKYLIGMTFFLEGVILCILCKMGMTITLTLADLPYMARFLKGKGSICNKILIYTLVLWWHNKLTVPNWIDLQLQLCHACSLLRPILKMFLGKVFAFLVILSLKDKQRWIKFPFSELNNLRQQFVFIPSS